MADDKGQQAAGEGSVPEHVKRLGVRFLQLRLEQESVREFGTVLVWHRWVDECLTEAIRAAFRPPKNAADRLLEYPGGLSSFSARVHLGKCIGVYGDVTYTDLKTINEIRNGFAHPRGTTTDEGDLEILGFANPDIAQKCLGLSFLKSSSISHLPSVSSPTSPADNYCQVCSILATSLWSKAQGGMSTIFDGNELP
jgi:DNA-binding MltR family transcriptional regulator